MNFSEIFIRRPVMTVLLNLSMVLAGIIGIFNIPTAALPSYDTPVINVSASLPGANPDTMATSVALQLEKQFQTVPGLKTISSTSTLGQTTLTLEFEEGRNIDAAAVDVQAAFAAAAITVVILGGDNVAAHGYIIAGEFLHLVQDEGTIALRIPFHQDQFAFEGCHSELMNETSRGSMHPFLVVGRISVVADIGDDAEIRGV